MSRSKKKSDDAPKSDDRHCRACGMQLPMFKQCVNPACSLYKKPQAG